MHVAGLESYTVPFIQLSQLRGNGEWYAQEQHETNNGIQSISKYKTFFDTMMCQKMSYILEPREYFITWKARD